MGHIEAALDVKNEALEKGIRSMYVRCNTNTRSG